MTLPPSIGLASQIHAELPLAQALARLAPHTGLVEIDSYGMHTVLSRLNRRHARESGLRLTVHGPDGNEIVPGSLDEQARRHTVAVHRRRLEAATEMGALVYVVHPDYMKPPRPRNPAVVEALQRTIADLEQAQRETGVRIVLENVPGVGRSHFVAPGELDLGELGLALDTGHAAISGTLDAFLREPQATLAHVHLHDNLGPNDADDPHRALGEGVVNVAAVLAAARAAGALVILEHHSEQPMLQSIAYLREHGFAPA
jgi:sugar phosphate isomerase/epimerase